MRFCAAACALLTVSTAAFGQFAGGVNIDFNSAAGAGAGQPTILYGGAAGQSGYWNMLNGPFGVGATYTVRNLANSADAVTLTVQNTTSTGAFSFNNANTSGDAELLLDDVHDLGGSGFALYTIGPFAGGVYDVYTYAVAPDSAANRMSVRAYSASVMSGVEVTVGGAIPAGGVLAAGVTHSVHRVAVARGERIWIQAQAAVGAGSINGIQIKPVTGFTRLYVGPGTPAGSQTGLSWAEACTELQRALSIASDTPGVTEIWITRGFQHPNRVLYGEADRDATFSVRSNLLLLGGFDGTEATAAERTTGGSATQLNGLGLARHVVTLSGATGVRIEDLNITEGNNELAISTAGNEGAGVRVVNGSGTFQRVRFGHNVAAGLGGVFSLSGASAVTVNDSDTIDNQAFSGSFAAVRGGSLTVNRCRLGNNTCTSTTAGVFDVNGASASLTLNNCLVANNQQPTWIIDASAGLSLGVYNCTFANNRSTAGANVGITGPHSSTIRNSIIYGNVGTAPASMSNVLLFSGGFASITDNTIQQWDGTLTGPASLNFDADPRFTLPAPAGLQAPGSVLGAGRYQLGSRSPARDSGWNAGAPAGNDVNGNPRIVDDPYFPNAGFGGGTVDRGCVEMQTASAVCPGDIGSTGGVPGPDGVRDNNDFVVFVDFFFTHNPIADVGRTGGIAPGDGAWDNNDFVVFIDQFFTACP